MTSDFFSRETPRVNPHKVTPNQALALSDKEKVDYFQEAGVRHPNLVAVLDQLDQLIFPSVGAELILLVGPPGVGKTRAIAEYEKRVLTRCLPRVYRSLILMLSSYMSARMDVSAF